MPHHLNPPRFPQESRALQPPLVSLLQIQHPLQVSNAIHMLFKLFVLFCGVCLRTHICTHMQICTHAHTHAHTHTHTHTHTKVHAPTCNHSNIFSMLMEACCHSFHPPRKPSLNFTQVILISSFYFLSLTVYLCMYHVPYTV